MSQALQPRREFEVRFVDVLGISSAIDQAQVRCRQ